MVVNIHGQAKHGKNWESQGHRYVTELSWPSCERKEMFRHGQFRFVLADTEDLKEKIFRLRYKTYVEEFGFEKPEDHPDGLEIDDFDQHSIHFAVLNESQDVIGTIRMILHSDKGFPVEQVANPSFIGKKPPPYKIAEISRFAISAGYRRRRCDRSYGFASYLKKHEPLSTFNRDFFPVLFDKRKNPLIMTGLYKIIYQTSKRLGITHWYMITEEKICRIFKKYGFLFYQVGEPLNYYGFRAPYLGIVDHIEKKLAAENPGMLAMMMSG